MLEASQRHKHPKYVKFIFCIYCTPTKNTCIAVFDKSVCEQHTSNDQNCVCSIFLIFYDLPKLAKIKNHKTTESNATGNNLVLIDLSESKNPYKRGVVHTLD